jgi:hypothetical protein
MSTNPETQAGTWTDYKTNRAKGIRVCRGDPDTFSVHTDEAGNIPLQAATARWPQLIRGTQLMDSKHGFTKGYWYKEPTLGWSWTSDDNGIIAMAIRVDEAFALLPMDTCISWILNMALVPTSERAQVLEDALQNKYTGEFLARMIEERWGKKFPIPTNLKPQSNNYSPVPDIGQVRPWRQHLEEAAHMADVHQVSDEDVINAWLYNHQHDADSDEENHHRGHSSKKAKNDAPWSDRLHIIHRTANHGGLSPRTKAAYHREFHRNTPVAVHYGKRGYETAQAAPPPGPLDGSDNDLRLDQWDFDQTSAARASTDPAPAWNDDPAPAWNDNMAHQHSFGGQR